MPSFTPPPTPPLAKIKVNMKIQAAMNAKKNFFQFIIVSVEVLLTPKQSWHVHVKWQSICRYKLQLPCSFDTTPARPRRDSGAQIQSAILARAKAQHRHQPWDFSP